MEPTSDYHNHPNSYHSRYKYFIQENIGMVMNNCILQLMLMDRYQYKLLSQIMNMRQCLFDQYDVLRVQYSQEEEIYRQMSTLPYHQNVHTVIHNEVQPSHYSSSYHISSYRFHRHHCYLHPSGLMKYMLECLMDTLAY